MICDLVTNIEEAYTTDDIVEQSKPLSIICLNMQLLSLKFDILLSFYRQKSQYLSIIKGFLNVAASIGRTHILLLIFTL